MPGWHDATQQLQDEGKLRMVGILQEQHPDRARLFMQWREMGWPLMVDSLDLLDLEVVPVTLLIDEEGIIRFRGREEHLADFLALESPEPRPSPAEVRVTVPERPVGSSAEALRHFADQTLMWGGDARIDAAIGAYEQALTLEPGHGATHFRLGVALRRRFDSSQRREGDFRRAVEQWGQALETNPNQYIWRRRIQQYGPRLDKPYPFYDWVAEARHDIAERGETPVEIAVEPRGAEIATPSRDFVVDFAASATVEKPANADRIRRDARGFVTVEATVVPAEITPGSSVRIHLAFRPRTAIGAHWNNEAEDLVVWLEPPAGWQTDRRQATVANPPELVSSEERRVELEVRSPESAQGEQQLTGFALYYVCEDIDGTCLYRRQDITVALPIRGR